MVWSVEYGMFSLSVWSVGMYVRDVQQFRGFSGCEEAQYNGVVNGERMFISSVVTSN